MLFGCHFDAVFIAPHRTAHAPTRSRAQGLPLASQPSSVDWSLVHLSCHGANVDVTGPRATFVLTPSSHSATCTYTDQYSSTVIPVAPPSPIAPGKPVRVTG